MIYFFKELPASDMDFTNYQPFIKNSWLRKHFMKFVYILQLVLVILSIVFGAWNFSDWLIKAVIFGGVYFIHELLHILVVYKIGNISLTHSGIFFWLNSDAIMSKCRFWLFMTLPLLVLTVIPMLAIPLTEGIMFQILRYIAWINAIIAGADIINSVLIIMKPMRARFCRGYYIVENK